MNQRTRSYEDHPPLPIISGDASHTTSMSARSSPSSQKKRKFVRRASVKPEIMRNVGSNNVAMLSNLGKRNFMSPNSMGTNTNVFLGEGSGGPTKQRKQ